MTTLCRRNQGDQRGMMGGLEGYVFGVLLFVFGTLIVADTWNAVDAKLATSAAAREATRSYVESSLPADASFQAREAASSVLTNQGHRTLDGFQVDLAGADGGYQRCGSVSITVATRVPRIPLPILHRHGGFYVVTSRHLEVIDPYRSGVSTRAAICGT